MFKIIAILFLTASAIFASQANAELTAVPESCPDMNGHFRHNQLGATADAYITQTACDTMRIQIQAKVLGTNYTEDVESPLDGVTRPTPPPANSNETDTVSGKWVGDTIVFIVDRYVTDNGKVSHTTTEVVVALPSVNKLHAEGSDLDANGNLSHTKGFDFDRVP